MFFLILFCRGALLKAVDLETIATVPPTVDVVAPAFFRFYFYLFFIGSAFVGDAALTFC